MAANVGYSPSTSRGSTPPRKLQQQQQPPAGILKKGSAAPSSDSGRSHTLPRKMMTSSSAMMDSDDGLSLNELPRVLHPPEDPRFRRGGGPSSTSGSFTSLNDAALAAVLTPFTNYNQIKSINNNQ